MYLLKEYQKRGIGKKRFLEAIRKLANLNCDKMILECMCGNNTINFYKYYGGAFTGILRFIFIFVMPSLLLGTIPVEIVKTLDLRSFIMIFLLTIFWFIASIMFFYKSLSKYESNNFFGFGS